MFLSYAVKLDFIVDASVSLNHSEQNQKCVNHCQDSTVFSGT